MTNPIQPARRVLTDTAERRQTVRTESVTHVRHGDVVGTRWEVVTSEPIDGPAQVYPLTDAHPAPAGRRLRWPVLLLAVVGAVAVVGGLVWAVMWLVHLVMHVIAVMLPTILGGLVVLALLAILLGGGGCGGLHCGGCKRH